MYTQFAIVALAAVLLSGCASPHMTISPVQAPPALAEEPRNGEILVYVGGNATRKGSLWIPQETSLASLEDLVAGPPEFASRHVRITRAGPIGGQRLDFRVNKMNRREKEAVKINHGDSIFFAYDRCFGFAPNKRPGVDAGWAVRHDLQVGC